MKITHIILVILFLNTFNLYSSGTAQQQFEPCKMKGMAGSQPDEVCQLKNFIMFLSDEFKSKRTLRKGPSVLLFCGKSGTGKTMATRKLLAELQAYEGSNIKKKSEKKAAANKRVAGKKEQISDNNDSGLEIEENENTLEKEEEVDKRFFYDTDTLIAKAGDHLSSIILKIYENALKIAHTEKHPIIIVFDDASTNGDSQKVFLFLKGIVDTHFDNPLITTIITSNSPVSSFDDSTRSRCTFVSWEMPDAQKRFEIIKYYNALYDAPLDDQDIKKLAKKYQNFSCRDIANAMRNAQYIATTNRNVFLKKHFEEAFEKENAIINPYRPGFFYKLWLAITFQSYTEEVKK